MSSFRSSTALLPRIITYNVNSLSFCSENRTRYNTIYSFIKDSIKDVDILCLQETNLTKNDRFALSSLNTPISRNNAQFGIAGTAIIDSPNITRFYSGTDVPLPDICAGRIQLRRYTPRFPRYQAFQLINVYFHSGPDYSANYPLIEAMLDIENHLPTFLVGDWNFIERSDDSSLATYPLPPRPFKDLFNQLLNHFSATELEHDSHTYYHISKNSNYSWTSRLDRIYIPLAVSLNPIASPHARIYHHTTNYSLKNSYHFSDHLPLLISYDSHEHSSSRPTINRWVASSPEFSEALKKTWSDLPISRPYRALELYKKALFHAAHSAKRTHHKNSSAHIRLSHHLALLHLMQHPNQDHARIDKLTATFPQLQLLIKMSPAGWIDNGLEEAINGLLSDSTKETTARGLQRNVITSLSESAPHEKSSLCSLRRDLASPPADDREGMANIAKDYWSTIWTKRPTSPTTNSTRDTFLNNYHKTVNRNLLHKPDFEDILAIIHLPKNTCAGPDGISFAAWRAWPEASANVLHAVLNTICSGRKPPPGFNKGLLFLLPKKNTGIVSDTRPLSITNTDNRILASAMAKACSSAIRDLIHPAQKGFLENVVGTEHIVDINSLYYGDLEKGVERFAFFLDTAKAFDSIDHDWIHEVLARAAFPKWFTHFVKGSLDQVSVTPFFNGLSDATIDITRGVKQGCPLSPLLFIIAYDPLIHSLASLDDLSQHAYADDLAMTTSSIQAIYPALTTIDNFTLASGLGINKDKSCVISNFADSDGDELLSKSPWPTLRLSNKTTYLGIPIGPKVTLEDIWELPLTRARTRLHCKNFIQGLNINNRITYVNTFVISLFSYTSLFFVLPESLWKDLQKELRDALIPFNGGAYTYEMLICAQHLLRVKPLKDVWAQNVALLAARSPLINATCTYNELPDHHVPMETTKIISIHRDAAAVDYWRGAHFGGQLLHSKPPTSGNIYKSLIADVFGDETRRYFAKRVNDNFHRYSLRPDFLPSPAPSAFSILDNIRLAKNIPNSVFYHHMALCLNALATSSRIRHFAAPTITECAFCGCEEDSLYHIYARCDVVAAARCLFLSSQQSLSKCPIPHPHSPDATQQCIYRNFPLAFSLLSNIKDNLVNPILIFNLAVWRFRLPSAASRVEKGLQWIAARIAATGCTLSSTKHKSTHHHKDHHNLALAGIPSDAIVCYTDGSASPNPGPCGAGVFICDPLTQCAYDGGTSIGYGSNNIGELVALGLCLKKLCSLPHPRQIIIFTDSELSLNLLKSSKRPRSNADLTTAVRRSLARAKATHTIEIRWIKGHADITGNNRVDQIAKLFAPLPGSLDLTFQGQFISSHWPYGPLGLTNPTLSQSPIKPSTIMITPPEPKRRRR